MSESGSFETELRSAQDTFDAGNALGAIEEFNRIAEYAQGAARVAALQGKGLAEFKLGNAKSALDTVRQAAEYDPHNADTWYMLGRAVERVGSRYNAVSCFTLALRLDPGHVPSKRNLERLAKAAKGDVARIFDATTRGLPLSFYQSRTTVNKGDSAARLDALLQAMSGEYRPHPLGVLLSPTEWLRGAVWHPLRVFLDYRTYLLAAIVSIVMLLIHLSVLVHSDATRLEQVARAPLFPEPKLGEMGYWEWHYQNLIATPALILSARIVFAMKEYLLVFAPLITAEPLHVGWSFFNNLFWLLLLAMNILIVVTFFAILTRMLDLCTQRYTFSDGRILVSTGFWTRHVENVELYKVTQLSIDYVGLHRIAQFHKVNVEYKSGLGNIKSVVLHSLSPRDGFAGSRFDAVRDAVLEMRNLSSLHGINE